MYLPYKQKRKTRASIARENGLEPLSEIIFKQQNIDINKIASSFLNDNVPSVEDAIQGAKDIIAEQISENAQARERVRKIFSSEAIITSKVVKSKIEEAEKYQDYFDFSQELSKCPSHRILAMRRGEREGFLRIDISPDKNIAFKSLKYLFVKGKTNTSALVEEAMVDAYDRLLKPSIDNEFANLSKESADILAIEVFADNLRQLLLAPNL